MNRRKFNRNVAHYRALMKNLSIALIEHKKIETTIVKAKELRRFIEPMITLAKIPSLSNRRRLLSKLFNNTEAVNELVKIAHALNARNGGYTSIKRVRIRTQDAAVVAEIKLLDCESLIKNQSKDNAQSQNLDVSAEEKIDRDNSTNVLVE